MYYTNYGDRFVLPFLLGGLVGAGAVGISRPRPVFVNQPPMMPYQQPIITYQPTVVYPYYRY